MFKLNKLAVISAVLISGTAFAGVNGNDFNGGLGIGSSFYNPDYATGVDADEQDVALQAFLGYDIGENFGIEASYADLGNLDVDNSGKVGVDVVSLQGLLYLPSSSNTLSVYAKLGASYVNVDNAAYDTADIDEDWSVSGGLGVRWNMDDNWFARAEYDFYNSDVQAAFFNIGYSWGAPEAIVEQPVVVVKPQVITIDDNSSVAIFDFDSAEINNPARLDQIVSLLQASRGQIIVKAHTDSIGTEAYNQKLSEKRAQSAIKYFVSRGIDANRFIGQGMGELYPVASNQTKEGRAQNRRLDVEYTIQQQKYITEQQ